MNYQKILGVVVIVGVIVLVQAGSVNAHETGQNTNVLGLSTPPTAAQLGVPKPNFWNFLRLRIARTLTTSVNKKIELTGDLTSMRLLVAQNDPAHKLSDALKDFENEKNQIATIKLKKPGLVSDSTKKNLAKSSVMQTILLDTINNNNPSDAIAGQRDATIADATEDLSELDKQEVNEVIDDIDALIEDNEDLPENEVEKKMALTEDLNDHENELEAKTNEVDNNDNFDQALADQEIKVEKDISALPADTLQRVSDTIATRFQRHLVILEGILAAVPDSAKPVLQKVIDDATNRMVEKLQKQDDLVEKMFEGTKVSSEIENKVIERLKKEAEKEQKSIDKALEKFNKQVEKQGEENNKQVEKKIEKQKKETEKASEKSKKEQEKQSEKTIKGQEKKKEDTNKESQSQSSGDGSSSSSPSSESSQPNSGSSGSNNSGSSTEVEKQEIEIKAKDMTFDKINYTVKKDAQITVKFKNEDSIVHSLALNDYGLSTNAISKDGETTLTFTATKNTSFHCGIHPSMTGTITVQ